jgi:glycosyltransferase involved in cell wall biosynthesis
MKVLITIYRSLGYGGAEVSTRYLAEALEKQGHKAIIASTQTYPNLNTKLFKEFHKKPYFLQERYLTNFLTNIIKKEKINLVHAQDRLTSIPAIKAAKKCNIPVIIHFRDYWPECPKSSCMAPDGYIYNICSYKTIIKHYPIKRWIPDIYKWYYLKKSWKTLEKANAKIVSSKLEKNKLKFCNIKKNIRVIPIFRDPKTFQNIKTKEFKNKYKLKPIVILYIGSFFYTKGIPLLMKIMPKVIRQNKNVCFFLAGDGPMFNHVKKLIEKEKLQDQIILAGKVRYEDVPKAYKISDIVVMPTAWEEPFSGIPLESGASKRPFIANKIGAVVELKGKNFCILVEKDNIKEWIKSINKLIKDKKLREQMGKNAYNMFIKNYSSDIIIKKILNLYKETLK